MSILICGMEMPKSCDKCELMTANYGCVFVGAVGGESYRKRPFDCPLTEVPTPHGRLIDANEFLHRAIGTKCFRGDYALMLEELVGESSTIIPAEEGE